MVFPYIWAILKRGTTPISVCPRSMADTWLCAMPIAVARSDCFVSNPRSSRIRLPTAFQSTTICSHDSGIDIVSLYRYYISILIYGNCFYPKVLHPA
jgi:hypothetical protein